MTKKRTASVAALQADSYNDDDHVDRDGYGYGGSGHGTTTSTQQPQQDRVGGGGGGGVLYHHLHHYHQQHKKKERHHHHRHHNHHHNDHPADTTATTTTAVAAKPHAVLSRILPFPIPTSSAAAPSTAVASAVAAPAANAATAHGHEEEKDVAEEESNHGLSAAMVLACMNMVSPPSSSPSTSTAAAVAAAVTDEGQRQDHRLKVEDQPPPTTTTQEPSSSLPSLSMPSSLLSTSTSSSLSSSFTTTTTATANHQHHRQELDHHEQQQEQQDKERNAPAAVDLNDLLFPKKKDNKPSATVVSSTSNNNKASSNNDSVIVIPKKKNHLLQVHDDDDDDEDVDHHKKKRKSSTTTTTTSTTNRTENVDMDKDVVEDDVEDDVEMRTMMVTSKSNVTSPPPPCDDGSSTSSDSDSDGDEEEEPEEETAKVGEDDDDDEEEESSSTCSSERSEDEIEEQEEDDEAARRRPTTSATNCRRIMDSSSDDEVEDGDDDDDEEEDDGKALQDHHAPKPRQQMNSTAADGGGGGNAMSFTDMIDTTIKTYMLNMKKEQEELEQQHENDYQEQRQHSLSSNQNTTTSATTTISLAELVDSTISNYLLKKQEKEYREKGRDHHDDHDAKARSSLLSVPFAAGGDGCENAGGCGIFCGTDINGRTTIPAAPTHQRSTSSSSNEGGKAPVADSCESASTHHIDQIMLDEATAVVAKVEHMVAHEMSKLSFDDIQEVDDDLHGIRPPRGSRIRSNSPTSSGGSDGGCGGGGGGGGGDDGKAGQQTRALPDNVFFKDKLRQIDIVLDWMLTHHGTDTSKYERAMFLAPHVFDTEEFKLRFLRSTEPLHDSKQAAKKIVDYFHYKELLWGPERLVEGITYEDLTDDEKHVIESGCIQLQPNIRDKHGRPVAFFTETQTQCHFKSWKTLHRVLWYLVAKVVDDANVQEHGIVNINYNVSSTKDDGMPTQGWVPPSKAFLMAMSKPEIAYCLPVRYIGTHVCFNNPLLKYPMALFQQALIAISGGGGVSDSNTSATAVTSTSTSGCNTAKAPRFLRVRSHCGSNLEVLYELRRFGISGDAIPVNPDGTLKIRRHLEYIEECKRTEEIERQRRSSPPVSSSNGNKPIYIDIPGPNDVLLGRGKQYMNHPGNVKLDELVSKYRTQYFASQSSIEKNAMAQAIMSMIHDKKGRFLQRATAKDITNANIGKNVNLWVQIPDEAAWSKVSRRFRK